MRVPFPGHRSSSSRFTPEQTNAHPGGISSGGILQRLVQWARIAVNEAAATSDSAALRSEMRLASIYQRREGSPCVQQYPWPCAEQLRRACGAFEFEALHFATNFQQRGNFAPSVSRTAPARRCRRRTRPSDPARGRLLGTSFLFAVLAPTSARQSILTRRSLRSYALTDAALWRDRVFSHNFVRTTYNRIFRRNSTFVTSILVGAIGAEIFFDGMTNWVYGSLNRGVRPVIFQASVFVPSAGCFMNRVE